MLKEKKRDNFLNGLLVVIAIPAIIIEILGRDYAWLLLEIGVALFIAAILYEILLGLDHLIPKLFDKQKQKNQ